MRLVTFSEGGRARAGAVSGDQIVDLSASGYFSVRALLEGGAEAMSAAAKVIANPGATYARGDVKVLAPIPDPQKFICIGLNYRDHAIESGMDIPTTPTVFTKYHNAIAGPGDEVVLPNVSKQVDYEAELAFVIGKTAKQVAKADWKEYVFGYTICHDVSARDYQLATTQWTIGKTFDGFGPIGPELVSADEIENPNNLRISLTRNGETLQDSNTDQFVFDVGDLVEYLTSVMTLVPGDIISTGTPPGVGFARKPAIFLQPGDETVVSIEGIGDLRNSFVAEQ